MMHINEFEFYAQYLDYTLLIDSMKEKLDEAKKKNPGANYEESEKKIETLKRLQTQFHEMYHYQIAIDNQNARYSSAHVHLFDENVALKKEIENLKANINCI